MRKIALAMLALATPLFLAAVTVSGSAYSGSALAAPALDGQQIFLDARCNMCHSVSTAGIEATVKSEAMRGPDLATVGTSVDAATLTSFLRQEAEIGGARHKKAFKGGDAEMKALVAWIQAQKK